MNQLDATFNWVTERAKCSSSKVLQEIERQVKADVGTRNNLRTPDEVQYMVNFVFQSGPGAFYVAAMRDSERLELVIFEHFPEGIRVKYQDRSELVGILTLSNDGECRLKVKDLEEYNFWQFRKLALEKTFFVLTGSLRQ